MEPSRKTVFLCMILLVSTIGIPKRSDAQSTNDGIRSDLRIGDLCRLKGQEENTLMGLGLVVGLKGTGDGEMGPTSRGLARAMQALGGQMGVDTKGLLQTKELKDAKNVATVIVTVTIPSRGAQQGDLIDCTISAIGAKSLDGGTLLLTPLLGPRVDRPTVYALAQGQIVLPDPKMPTSAKITGGCKMEATVLNDFRQGDVMTLVIEPSHSSFSTAQTIAEMINDFHARPNSKNATKPANIGEHIAKAKDQMHVEVTIPSAYKDRAVEFAAEILDIRLNNLKSQKRVVIQQRSGVVIIGDDVTIEPVAIHHKNLVISTKAPTNGFVGVDTTNTAKDMRPRLSHLVDSLKVLAVPNEDVIAIIKALKHQGNLYGELVIE